MWSGTNKDNNNRMREVRIDFEEFDGDLDALISNSSDGEKYLLQMVDIEDKNEKVEVKYCEVHKAMNCNIGTINGHFSTDYHNFMKIVGICKLIV